MNPPDSLTKIIGGKRYSVAKSTLLAGNDYWDGHNFERRGTNTFLYRTPKGTYFNVNLTQWQGGSDTIEPLSEAEAKKLYESLSEQRVEYEQAFPGSVAEEA
jgi:hypothetical protein